MWILPICNVRLMSAWCQHDVIKNCCCHCPFYGQTDPCHIPGGGEDSLWQVHKSLIYAVSHSQSWYCSFFNKLVKGVHKMLRSIWNQSLYSNHGYHLWKSCELFLIWLFHLSCGLMNIPTQNQFTRLPHWEVDHMFLLYQCRIHVWSFQPYIHCMSHVEGLHL